MKLPTCLLTLTEKMRIDAYLFENGYTQSRTEAKSLILEGAVRVCDRVILKPSYDVSGNEHITVDTSLKKYVKPLMIKDENGKESQSVYQMGRICGDRGVCDHHDRRAADTDQGAELRV